MLLVGIYMYWDDNLFIFGVSIVVFLLIVGKFLIVISNMIYINVCLYFFFFLSLVSYEVKE